MHLSQSLEEAAYPAIYFYDDRLETAPYGVTPYTLGRRKFCTAISRPVNKKLFAIFVVCRFPRQAGHGAPEMVKAYVKEAFSLEDKGERFYSI